jgi:hypothetical protein
MIDSCFGLICYSFCSFENMIVYLYDSEMNEVSHDDIRHPELLFRVSVRNGTPLRSAITTVTNEFARRRRAYPGVNPRNTISKLVIMSHGAPGTVRIGDVLTPDNVSVLAPLTELFAPVNEGVIFEGCSIVSNTHAAAGQHFGSWSEILAAYPESAYPNLSSRSAVIASYLNPMGGNYQIEREPGMALLRAVASLLHTSVRAGIGMQLSDPNGPTVAGAVTDMSGFEGEYVRVEPSGQYTTLQGTPYSSYVRTLLTRDSAAPPPHSDEPAVDLSGLDRDGPI